MNLRSEMSQPVFSMTGLFAFVFCFFLATGTAFAMIEYGDAIAHVKPRAWLA